MKRSSSSLSPLVLTRERLDETTVKEEISKLAFIGSSSSIENEYEAVVTELTRNLFLVDVYIFLLCCFMTLIISIYFSRYFADNTMDKIITMCIKMKIARNYLFKLKRNKMKRNKVEFSRSSLTQLKDVNLEGYDEINVLLEGVEDIIKVINLRGFVLSEANSKKYNHEALIEYMYIAEKYSNTLTKIRYNKQMQAKKKVTLMYNYQRILCI